MKPKNHLPPLSHGRAAAALAIKSALEDLVDVEADLARSCKHLTDAGQTQAPEVGNLVDLGAVVRVVMKELRVLAADLEGAGHD